MNKLLKPRIVIPFVLVAVLSPLVFTYKVMLGVAIGISLVVVFAVLFISIAVSVIYLTECVYENKWMSVKIVFSHIKQLKTDIKELF